MSSMRVILSMPPDDEYGFSTRSPPSTSHWPH